MKEYKIAGQVMDEKTKKGIPGLRIEAWDKDLIYDDLIGSVTTGKNGTFQLEFTEKYFMEIFFDRRPDVYFKVFENKELLKSTEQDVICSMKSRQHNIIIILDYHKKTVPGESVMDVSGQVRKPEGTPLPGMVTKAFDKGMAKENLLGHCLTDEQGHYHIPYSSAQLSHEGKPRADLIVRVFEPENEEEPAAASPLILNAHPHEIINLAVGKEPYKGLSQYRLLEEKLVPEIKDTVLEKITGKDVAFLANKIDVDPRNVAYYVKAQRLGEITIIPAEVFFGLFSRDLPTSLAHLLAQDSNVLRQALVDAGKENIISDMSQEQLNNMMVRLEAQKVDQSLLDEVPDNTTLKGLLAAAGLSGAEKKLFLDIYVKTKKPIKEFWQGLREDERFGETKVRRLQLSLQLGAVTRNHLPLVNLLLNRQDINDARDLAKFGANDWLEWIKTPGINIPENLRVKGDNEEEKQGNYAKTMAHIIEDAFPTAVLAHQSSQDQDPANHNFKVFFANNPLFEFRSYTVREYLKENDRALAGINQPREFTKELESVQRLFRISPGHNKFNTVKKLRQGNLDSAHAVKRMGKSAFVRQYAKSLGSAETAQVLYNNAAKVSTMAMALYGKYSRALNRVGMYVFNNPLLPEDEGIPDWNTLFGSLDYCDCQHCASVLSPSAYLVDLLAFLDNTRAKHGDTGLEKLFARRPDIGNIDLNCKNTNIAMPYIDLVNEVLENAIKPRNYSTHTHDGTTYKVGEVPQTRASDSDLKANPEHINIEAYDELIARESEITSYPWNLPFSLWVEEARVYLEHLGVKRYRLMEAFRRPDADTPSQIDIAAEYLGMLSEEKELIVTPAPGPAELKKYWGIPADNTLEIMTGVSDFLRQSGLEYRELKELLETNFVNPVVSTAEAGGTDRVIIRFAGEQPCSLDHAVLAFSSGDLSGSSLERILDRVHRFTRLQGKPGWSAIALDKALNALELEDMEDDTLILHLANIKRLQAQLQVPLVEMLSWWDTIDTSGYNYKEEKCLYESVFLNKTVNSLLEDIEAVFGLNSERNELNRTDTLLTDPEYVPLVLAAVNLSADDLSLIAAKEFPGEANINLRSLSLVFRIASFTRALKISVREYFSLKVLTGIQALAGLTGADAAAFPNDTLNFVEICRSIEKTGFTIEELDYLLRHYVSPVSTLPPSGELVRLLLVDIRTELQKIAGENPGTGGEEENELKENYVIQKLAAVLNLDSAVAENLLKTHMSHPSAGDKKAIDVYLEDSFLGSSAEMTRGDFTIQWDTFAGLFKIALVLNKLNLPLDPDLPGAVEFIFRSGPGIGWLDLANLPLENIEDPVAVSANFRAWQRLLRASQLEKSLFKTSMSVYHFLAAANDESFTKDNLLQTLSDNTGWNLVDIQDLTAVEGYDFSYPEDYRDEQWLIKLQAAFEMVKRIGVGAMQTWHWNTPGVTFDQARAIRNAAKAKYDNEKWLEIAPGLRDQLRERQRDALQAYVMHKKGFKDTNELFAHYLIDTEMSACGVTSRTKLAVSSVQLFVQRILMNLEEDTITFTREEAREWKWRKNYRVWEANRKVFLYPENWIEPGLRDDRSPFFKDLENELLQDDINADTAERVYLNYLKKLDQVSDLEIGGLYIDTEQNITHVLARSKDQPHIYYYRRWMERSYWTPWEKVELDIQGDHLIPVVYNRRLTVFWPVFTEIAKEPAEDQLKNDDTGRKKPLKRYEIQLAWSEYRQGKWSAKKISNQSVKTGYFQHGPPPREMFYFRASIDRNTNDLIIAIYWLAGNTIFEEYDQFKFSGCNKEPQVGHFITSDLFHIANAGSYYMKKTRVHPLAVRNLPGETRSVHLIRASGVIYRATLPHQYPIYASQAPLFYEDNLRTFFIIPENVYEEKEIEQSLEKENVTPDVSGIILFAYYHDEPKEMSVIKAAGDTLTGRDDDSTGSNYYSGNTGSGLIVNRQAGETPAGNISVLIQGILGEVTTGDLSVLFKTWKGKKYRFQTFYHPYVCLLIKQLNRYGIEGLLAPEPGGDGTELLRQLTPNTVFDFEEVYNPNMEVVAGEFLPVEDIDFKYDGAYSQYNWELFFHAPLLIACRLSQNQRFQEAQKWFHFIFDPTESEGNIPERFWKIKPFYQYCRNNDDADASIRSLLKQLNGEDTDLKHQVDRWEQDPFNPHLIARFRITAYMKTVIMKYIDNLIAWGDGLFRQDTIESINEATQVYVLAAQILGRPPVRVEGKTAPTQTFNDLFPHLDEFNNALVQIESEITSGPGPGLGDINQSEGVLDSLLYFCIPENQKLLSYWDTVADRLFKIRHCMNIEGVVRQLPLFQPPIDPGLLVKAAAAGVDISSALSDMSAPFPYYRFNFMRQKALEFCNDVKTLGAALLSALEKRDAEALSLLRAGHELQLLQTLRQIKDRSIEEAKESLQALKTSREIVDSRYQYYNSREFMNPAEMAHVTLMGASAVVQAVGEISQLVAFVAHTIPDFNIGVSGIASPVAVTKYGGSNVARSTRAFADAMRTAASILNTAGAISSTIGSYQRRQDDWEFQADTAAKELEQIDKQITAAEIRLAIAEKDLEAHDQQTENAKETEEFMRTKYTNKELYDWMVTQLSALYFQAYQVAYDMAKRAEKSFQHELAVYDTNFIQFGYWDNLKKGLLSGERLNKDFRRMEMAYIDRHKREYEITRHISLVRLNPAALLQLQETGTCEIHIPEVLFDLDFPGQYLRRIKSVHLTIPCVTGPFTNVSCKLTLLKNRIRTSTELNDEEPYYSYAGIEDSRFIHDLVGIQSIATSSAQNDNGLFEFNFRDERYLPFEGAGVISTWRIQLPVDFKQFNYNTVSDVIIHINYTAREGGDAFKNAVSTEVTGAVKNMLKEIGESGTDLLRLFSLKHEFPNHWHQLLHHGDHPQTITFDIHQDHFPYMLKGENLQLSRVTIYLQPKTGETIDTASLALTIRGEEISDTEWSGPPDTIGDLLETGAALSGAPSGEWQISFPNNNLNPETVEDMYLLLEYTIV